MGKEEQIKRANTLLFDQKEADSIEKFFSADYIAHADNKENKGHDFIRRFVRQIWTALPDVSVKKIEVLACDNNTITWQRTLTGTHKESMMGIPPSGKKIKWNEMIVSRFNGDSIVEEWVVSELAGHLMMNKPGTIA